MGEGPQVPRVIANWWLDRLLGSGYSGSIFQARHLHTGQIVALKVQHAGHECPTNQYEKHVYPSLQAGKGMPTYWAGGVEGEWDYIAIDLLGASLDNIYRKAGGPAQVMDLGSVCCIAMQMIERLQLMHARGILHRDIQLGNAVIGLRPNHETLYMIDFGFSKRYIDQYTRRHIPDSKVKRDFIGNYWFSSVNVHCRGKVPSRRDDLEACALMLIHLLTPRGLAWTRDGVPKTETAHTRLKQLKRSTTPGDLCRGLPTEFEEFLRYCRQLKFVEQPDYGRWIEEFRELKMDHGYNDSDALVWPPPKPAPKANLHHRLRSPGVVVPDTLHGILNDLANLNFNQEKDKRHATLGDRTGVLDGDRIASKENPLPSEEKEAISISSGSETFRDRPKQPAVMETKAARILKLVGRASQATDNEALSKLVGEFVEALQCNRSRTLTKEASMFLDALCKQLEDPSVFIAPVRTSRQRSDIEKTEPREPAHVRLGVVARLRREVGRTSNNKALASMVAEFGKITNKTTGRTITKDGFAFLEGVAERLLILR